MRWVGFVIACLGWLYSMQSMAAQPSAVEKHLYIQGVDREYLLFDAHQQQPAPLVVVLHGGGGNASRMLKRWQNVAQREGLIVVAPDAEKSTWNATGCCGQSLQQQSADTTFIQKLVQEMQQHYAIDAHRIYVVGFSNGGMLTYQLLAQQHIPFAAAAVVSGAMFNAQMQQAQSPVPLLMVHGLQDRVVPMQGGVSQIRFVARAQTQAFVPFSTSVEFWQKRNQCQSATRSNTPQVEILSYQHCKADLQIYQLKDEGHGWIEARRANQFDTTEAIWSFLKQKHH